MHSLLSMSSINKFKNWILSHKLVVFIVLMVLVIAAIGMNLPPNFLDQKTSSDDKSSGIHSWSCLFYFDGDNNLAEYNEMLTNLEFLQRVGSTDKVHMICLLDRDGANDSKVLYIKKGSSDEIPLSDVNPSWTDEVDMANPNTLTDMAKWTFDTYPAERHLILLSNHGGGWRGICWDDNSEGDNLDLADLKTSLSELKSYYGRKLDILATEACLVGMVEFVYPIKDCTDYFIGSQAFSFGAENTSEGGILVGNWQYDLMWGELVAHPSMTPKEFCQVIINNFKQYGPWRAPPGIPKTESSDTLSVIDTTQVEKVRVSGKTHYRVRVGPFLERDAAEQKRKQLADKFKLSGRVLSYP